MSKPHAIITRNQLDALTQVHHGYSELIREAALCGVGGLLHQNALDKLTGILEAGEVIISTAEREARGKLALKFGIGR